LQGKPELMLERGFHEDQEPFRVAAATTGGSRVLRGKVNLNSHHFLQIDEFGNTLGAPLQPQEHGEHIEHDENIEHMSTK